MRKRIFNKMKVRKPLMVKKPKTLVLLSGGLDSSVCLAREVKQLGNENVIALNAYYGQKHQKEIECARKIADFYKVRYLEIDLSEVMKYSDCSLLQSSDKAIPQGSYAEQEREEGKPVSTYVPFRNGVLASVASSIAISLGADVVCLGIHKDDVAGQAYPDCSIDFYDNMATAIYEGTGGQVRLLAPFVDSDKAEIVRQGIELGVPFEFTWSCYEGGEKPCGKCGTCIDRRKAFEANGKEDPLCQL